MEVSYNKQPYDKKGSIRESKAQSNRESMLRKKMGERES